MGCESAPDAEATLGDGSEARLRNAESGNQRLLAFSGGMPVSECRISSIAWE